MRRREFIAGLGAAAWPFATQAPQRSIGAIGRLEPAPGFVEGALPAFSNSLAQGGFIMGRNLTIKRRSLRGDNRELPALAADLLHRQVGAIVIVGLGAALAVKSATQTIPVIFTATADAVKIVSARPSIEFLVAPLEGLDKPALRSIIGLYCLKARSLGKVMRVSIPRYAKRAHRP
jgi:putative ABC transport system substrate-binding protein